MPKKRTNPVFVFEDLSKITKFQIGTFLGVRITATYFALLGPVLLLLFSIGAVYLMPDMNKSEDRNLFIVVIWVSLHGMLIIHSLGHILGGKMVGSAMDELLLTLTRYVNIYEGPQDQFPARVHLGRALGGLSLNLLVAGLFLYITLFTQNTFARDFIAWGGYFNLVFGLGSFLPVRSVDGEVIWRVLLRR